MPPAAALGGAAGQLFEAYIGTADAPTLHDAQELELQLQGLTVAGEGVLAAVEADQLLLAASHAIRGWACLIDQGHHMAADAVRLSLRRFVPGHDALSRGSRAAGEPHSLIAAAVVAAAAIATTRSMAHSAHTPPYKRCMCMCMCISP